jgi:Holliday junction resolvase
VGSGSSAYERELKEILQGDPEAVARYAKSIPPAQREVLDGIHRAPFLVVRAAGSLGFDLVALRSEFAFPLEVKSSSSDTIRFSSASGRASAQLDAHRRAVERVGLMVLYAYRRLGRGNGEPWRVYAGGRASPKGRCGFLNRRLPPVETTKEGNGVLRWGSGMPLSEFVRIVATLTDPVAPGPAP